MTTSRNLSPLHRNIFNNLQILQISTGVLQHLAEVKEILDKALAIVGPEGLRLHIMGPGSELEKLRPTLGPLGAEFFNLDPGALAFHSSLDCVKKDSHVLALPFFNVPEDKMAEFCRQFANFYRQTQQGTGQNGQCLYYGFAQGRQGPNNVVFCREGYKDAKAFLQHMTEAEGPLKAAFAMLEQAGAEPGKLSIIGPPEELKILKQALTFQADFFDLDANALSKID